MSHASQGSRAALLAASLVVAGLSVSAFASQRAQTITPTALAPRSLGPASAQASQAQALREGRPLDVNDATAEDLRLLPGIGPMLASRIVAHRARIGRFSQLRELDAVPGIGPKTLQRITPLLTIDADKGAASQGEQPAR